VLPPEKGLTHFDQSDSRRSWAGSVTKPAQKGGASNPPPHHAAARGGRCLLRSAAGPALDYLPRSGSH
jgi:hypothetical protein